MLPAACSHRPPVPPGTIPEQSSVAAEDEEYGHEVLNSLVEQFPLDTDDNNINRVRDIVDRLTLAANASTNPWHVNVLVGDEVKNAAATRGNYVFVWTGMLKQVQNDDELATILAHEIGHVLAGHTAPDPAQEASQILAGIAGTVAGSVVSGYGYSPVADLADLLIRSTIEAILVNPISQDDEFEADHIGLFLLSDAGYDPDKAIAFWIRAEGNPDFSGAALEFLSTHPSTEDRVAALQEHLTAARDRYAASLKHKGKPPATKRAAIVNSPPPPPAVIDSPPPPPARRDGTPRKSSLGSMAKAQDDVPAEIPPPRTGSADLARVESGRWVVQEESVAVFSDPDPESEKVGDLSRNTPVEAVALQGRWLEIKEPVAGYVRSRDLAPE